MRLRIDEECLSFWRRERGEKVEVMRSNEVKEKKRVKVS